MNPTKQLLNRRYGRVGIASMVTLKIDKEGRLCAWLGNVQSKLTYDKWGKLIAIGEHELCRLEGIEKDLIISKLPQNYQVVVNRLGPVVFDRKVLGL